MQTRTLTGIARALFVVTYQALFFFVYIFLFSFFVKLKGTYMTYTDSCSSYLCNPNYGLTCSSTANSCQCPSNMATYHCDCATTQYWNGARCVERSTYNNACPTLQNYNCYSGKNMICSGGTCLCVNSDYYWVSALDSCSKFLL